MNTIHGIENLSGIGTSVALGNFDGLHIGHMRVLENAVTGAQGAEPVVLMFEDHPRKLLSGRMPPRLITPGLRTRMLREVGILLIGELRARALSCGYNYRFGARGAGDVALLRELCAARGVALHVADCAEYAGEPVSSTRIRAAIADGRAREACRMLGHPFSYDFTVVSGDRRGRLLGFPTINQFFPEDYAVPKFGVYAARAWVHGRYYPAMANIGVRPTIGTQSMRSETCILGFSGDLYGKNVEVGLLAYLRPEKKFEGLEALAAQMNRDAEGARAAFDAFQAGSAGK